MRRRLAIAGSIVVGAALAASGAAANGTVSAQDANYLQTSISGDRFEIIGGKIALQKGTTARVRALGARLVRDHSKSLAEAVKEAKEDGVKIPQAPTPSMVWELNMVRSLSGVAFDKAYASLEVKDHQQDIEENVFESVHGRDPGLRRSARKEELPMLKMHLQLSQKALRSL